MHLRVAVNMTRISAVVLHHCTVANSHMQLEGVDVDVRYNHLVTSGGLAVEDIYISSGILVVSSTLRLSSVNITSMTTNVRVGLSYPVCLLNSSMGAVAGAVAAPRLRLFGGHVSLLNSTLSSASIESLGCAVVFTTVNDSIWFEVPWIFNSSTCGLSTRAASVLYGHVFLLDAVVSNGSAVRSAADEVSASLRRYPHISTVLANVLTIASGQSAVVPSSLATLAFVALSLVTEASTVAVAQRCAAPQHSTPSSPSELAVNMSAGSAVMGYWTRLHITEGSTVAIGSDRCPDPTHAMLDCSTEGIDPYMYSRCGLLFWSDTASEVWWNSSRGPPQSPTSSVRGSSSVVVAHVAVLTAHIQCVALVHIEAIHRSGITLYATRCDVGVTQRMVSASLNDSSAEVMCNRQARDLGNGHCSAAIIEQQFLRNASFLNLSSCFFDTGGTVEAQKRSRINGSVIATGTVRRNGTNALVISGLWCEHSVLLVANLSLSGLTAGNATSGVILQSAGEDSDAPDPNAPNVDALSTYTTLLRRTLLFGMGWNMRWLFVSNASQMSLVGSTVMTQAYCRIGEFSFVSSTLLLRSLSVSRLHVDELASSFGASTEVIAFINGSLTSATSLFLDDVGAACGALFSESENATDLYNASMLYVTPLSTSLFLTDLLLSFVMLNVRDGSHVVIYRSTLRLLSRMPTAVGAVFSECVFGDKTSLTVANLSVEIVCKDVPIGAAAVDGGDANGVAGVFGLLFVRCVLQGAAVTVNDTAFSLSSNASNASAASVGFFGCQVLQATVAVMRCNALLIAHSALAPRTVSASFAAFFSIFVGGVVTVEDVDAQYVGAAIQAVVFFTSGPPVPASTQVRVALLRMHVQFTSIHPLLYNPAAGALQCVYAPVVAGEMSLSQMHVHIDSVATFSATDDSDGTASWFATYRPVADSNSTRSNLNAAAGGVVFFWNALIYDVNISVSNCNLLSVVSELAQTAGAVVFATNVWNQHTRVSSRFTILFRGNSTFGRGAGGVLTLFGHTLTSSEVLFDVNGLITFAVSPSNTSGLITLLAYSVIDTCRIRTSGSLRVHANSTHLSEDQRSLTVINGDGTAQVVSSQINVAFSQSENAPTYVLVVPRLGLVRGVALRNASTLRIMNLRVAMLSPPGSSSWLANVAIELGSQVVVERSTVFGTAALEWWSGGGPLLPTSPAVLLDHTVPFLVIRCVRSSPFDTDATPNGTLVWLTRLRGIPRRWAAFPSTDSSAVHCGSGFEVALSESTTLSGSVSGASLSAAASRSVSTSRTDWTATQGTSMTQHSMNATYSSSATTTRSEAMTGSESLSMSATAEASESATLSAPYVTVSVGVLSATVSFSDVVSSSGSQNTASIVPSVSGSATASATLTASRPPFATTPFLSEWRAAASVGTVVVGALSALFVQLSVAGDMQRTMLLLQLASCDTSQTEPLAVSDSPTRLGFGDPLMYYIRGAVVGNAVFLLGGSLAVTLLIAAALERVARRTGTGGGDSKGVGARWGTATRMPGALVVPLMLFVQPTVSNSVRLLQPRESDPIDIADVVIGVAGLATTTATAAHLIWRVSGIAVALQRWCSSIASAWSPSHDPFSEWIECGRAELPRRPRRASVFGDFLHRARLLLSPLYEWRARRGRKDAGRLFLKQYGYVLEEFKRDRHWFFVVELGGAGVVGIIGGVQPASASGCTGSVASILAVSLILFGLNAWLRPRNSVFANTNAVLGALISVVAAVLLLSSPSAEDTTDSIALVLLLVSAVATAAGVTDVALRSVARFVNATAHHRSRGNVKLGLGERCAENGFLRIEDQDAFDVAFRRDILMETVEDEALAKSEVCSSETDCRGSLGLVTKIPAAEHQDGAFADLSCAWAPDRISSVLLSHAEALGISSSSSTGVLLESLGSQTALDVVQKLVASLTSSRRGEFQVPPSLSSVFLDSVEDTINQHEKGDWSSGAIRQPTEQPPLPPPSTNIARSQKNFGCGVSESPYAVTSGSGVSARLDIMPPASAMEARRRLCELLQRITNGKVSIS